MLLKIKMHIGSGNCGMDVTVEPLLGPDAPIFYNQWELQVLKSYIIPITIFL